MKGPVITPDQIKPMLETPFLRVADIQYAEGRHYYTATRRPVGELTAVRPETEFLRMAPDAATCIVILRTPDCEPRLLLTREYRFPAVPAGRTDRSRRSGRGTAGAEHSPARNPGGNRDFRPACPAGAGQSPAFLHPRHNR